MRSHPGNRHKEAKALPSSKARPNKVQLQSTLEQRGSFLAITAFRKRSQTLLTIAFFSQIWLSLSTPVEISSWPDLTSLSSLAL